MDLSDFPHLFCSRTTSFFSGTYDLDFKTCSVKRKEFLLQNMFGKKISLLFQNIIFMKIWQNYGLQTLFGQIDNGLHLLLRLFFYILPAGKDIRIGLLYEIKSVRMGPDWSKYSYA